MKNLVQKILFNESFPERHKKKILRSPLLLLCEQIKAAWMGLNEAGLGALMGGGGGRTWTFVASLWCSCMRLHLERWRQKEKMHYQQNKTKWDLHRFKVGTNCCSDRKTIKDMILWRGCTKSFTTSWKDGKDLVKANVTFSILQLHCFKMRGERQVKWGHLNWLTFYQAWTDLPVGENGYYGKLQGFTYCEIQTHHLCISSVQTTIIRYKSITGNLAVIPTWSSSRKYDLIQHSIWKFMNL